MYQTLLLHAANVPIDRLSASTRSAAQHGPVEILARGATHASPDPRRPAVVVYVGGTSGGQSPWLRVQAPLIGGRSQRILQIYL